MKTSNQAQVTVSKSRHSYFSFQWKSHFKKGKIVTNTDESIYNQLKENFNNIQEEDVQKRLGYVLKSKSENTEIKSLKKTYIKLDFHEIVYTNALKMRVKKQLICLQM